MNSSFSFKCFRGCFVWSKLRKIRSSQTAIQCNKTCPGQRCTSVKVSINATHMLSHAASWTLYIYIKFFFLSAKGWWTAFVNPVLGKCPGGDSMGSSVKIWVTWHFRALLNFPLRTRSCTGVLFLVTHRVHFGMLQWNLWFFVWK